MRKVIALFDEHQSKENAQYEANAEQGFWNSAPGPRGYVLVDVEKRGIKIKKTLAIDPVDAETVQLIYKLSMATGRRARSLSKRSSNRGRRDPANGSWPSGAFDRRPIAILRKRPTKGNVNGIGTVQSIEPHRIEVVTDSGTTVAFGPERFPSWGLGYCGTVYRSQGKTQESLRPVRQPVRMEREDRLRRDDPASGGSQTICVSSLPSSLAGMTWPKRPITS